MIKLRHAKMDAYKGGFCCSLIAIVSLEGLKLCGRVRIVCIFLNLLSVIKTTVNLLPFLENSLMAWRPVAMDRNTVWSWQKRSGSCRHRAERPCFVSLPGCQADCHRRQCRDIPHPQSKLHRVAAVLVRTRWHAWLRKETRPKGERENPADRAILVVSQSYGRHD